MATPTIPKNKDRVLRKIMAILTRPASGGAARASTTMVGHATLEKARNRVSVCAGAPTAGPDVSAGDLCLDTTNHNVYRYYDSAWDRLDVTT